MKPLCVYAWDCFVSCCLFHFRDSCENIGYFGKLLLAEVSWAFRYYQVGELVSLQLLVPVTALVWGWYTWDKSGRRDFCCVIWTSLSELAKLIEQLVTAEGGNLPPAAFPSLTVTTAWSLNTSIQQQPIQLKKLVFCKAVRVGHIKKELDECSAGDKKKRRGAGEEQKHLPASQELSGGLSCLV